MADMKKSVGRQEMGRNSNEVKLWRAGASDNGENSYSELKSLVDSCPGVKQRIILENPGSLLAKLFFSSPEGAVEGFAFLWKKRLSGVHSWRPELCSGFGHIQRKAQERTREVFLEHLKNVRDGEVAGKCKKEIAEVDMEYSECINLLRKRNRVREWHKLEGLKHSLDAQGKILRKKFVEFGRALQCLETYLKNPLEDYDYFDTSGEERPVFVLGNGWTWEQLNCIIVRECRRFESSLPMYSSRRDILAQAHLKQEDSNLKVLNLMV